MPTRAGSSLAGPWRTVQDHRIPNPAFLLFGAVVLFALGAWTVTHPNGGYRAAGGAGSSLRPETRRAAGYVLMVAALLAVVLVAVD